MSLDEIIKLIGEFKLTQAEQEIEKQNLSNTFEGKIAKSLILFSRDQFFDHFKLIKELSEKVTDSQNSRDLFIITIIRSLTTREAQIASEQLPVMLVEASDEIRDELSDWMVWYYVEQSLTKLFIGDLDQAEILVDKAAGKISQVYNPFLQCFHYLAHAVLDYYKRGFTEGIEGFYTYLDFCIKIGNPKLQLTGMVYLAETLNLIGDSNKALAIVEQGYTVSEKHNFRFIKIDLTIQKASILRNLGKLEEALKYCNFAQINHLKLLGISKDQLLATSHPDIWTIEYILHIRGHIHFEIGNFTEAIDDFRKCIVLIQNFILPNMSTFIGEIKLSSRYYIIIQTFLANDQGIDAQQILDDLKNLDQSKPSIKYRTQVAEGLILKSSKKMRDKVLAQQIFRDTVTANPDEFNVINLALYSLCELMIEEVSLYGDDEVFSEVTELVETIYNKAEVKNHPKFKIESMLLKSKFMLLHGDIAPAQNLIFKALELAEEYGMNKQIDRIKQEQRIINDEMNLLELKEMSTNQLTIQEKLKKIEMQSYLKKALNIIKIG